jgi:hypothetical protein
MAAQGLQANDPVSVLRQYIEDFNKGDVQAMAGRFTVPGTILDGLAPHVWHGPTVCQDWYRDVLIAAKHEDATDYFVTLGTPLHANVIGDSAYVVVPARLA